MFELSPFTREGREQLWNDLINRINSLQADMNRLFGDAMTRWDAGIQSMKPFFTETEKYFRQFIPSVNIKETEKEIVVTAELPGLEKKDITITHTDSALVIEGEKKYEKKEEKEKVHIMESAYGSFRRVIALPQEIDFSKIDATFKNGVLTVVLPKTEKARENVRKIEVKEA
ncbi:MAG: Hsp20/alpha crystallin family protein [Leptospiraceae bacterium]|nr:Hsp20/alpha crystallin family protein [Leptospiraceae bacterium]MDW8306246.1 Hsp20/alpha crystallin family protein [Leptospiraceae bacterium]